MAETSAAAVPAPGLRERKKQRTRRHIAETARRLFAERGFDQVTVADVARAAEVAQQTVFNYFPTKEDLVYWQLESFEQELLDAIRLRGDGESILTAFGRFVGRPRGLLGKHDPAMREQLTALTRVISESPALLAREQQVFARYTDSLARAIAGEQGADPDAVEPWVAANALMGVHRGLVAHARREILAGADHDHLADEVRAEAARALALLEHGLEHYGRRSRRPGAA